MRCFKKAPESIACSPRMMKECPQIFEIIEALAKQGAIVSNELTHITTWKNLSSICKEDGSTIMYGAENLKRMKLKYDPNVLVEDDVVRGDGNAICFGVNLIDYNAVLKDDKIKVWVEDEYDSEDSGEEQIVHCKTLKEGAVKIKVDMSKSKPQGPYSQFFKIKDFGSQEFWSVCTLTSWLTVQFESPRVVGKFHTIRFKIKDEFGSVNIVEEDNLFYGNLFQINRFCMYSLFNLVDKTNNEALVKAFYVNMKLSSKEEIVKILKLFGQNLTAYAECNFHGRVDGEDHFITEITDVKTGKCYTLKNLSQNIYRKYISSIAKANLKGLPESDRIEKDYIFYPEGSLEILLGASSNPSTFRV